MTQEIISSNYQLLPALEPLINSNTFYINLETGIQIEFNPSIDILRYVPYSLHYRT